LIAALCIANATGVFAGPKVGSFLDSEVPAGCGTNFELPEQGNASRIFLYWLENEDAHIRVDGKLKG
jgi:hypothetical protein